MADKKNQLKIKIDFRQFYLWDVKVLLAIALVLCTCISYLIYNNLMDEPVADLSGLHSEEQQLKQSLKEQYGLIRVLPQYEEKVAELDKVEALVYKQFPDDDETPNMLVQINQLAELSGVSINSLLPNAQDTVYTESGIDIPKDSTIWTKSFTLNGSSNMMNLISFTYKIAEYPRVIQLDNVSIDRVDNDKVNFVMTVSIFFVK